MSHRHLKLAQPTTELITSPARHQLLPWSLTHRSDTFYRIPRHLGIALPTAPPPGPASPQAPEPLRTWPLCLPSIPWPVLSGRPLSPFTRTTGNNLLSLSYLPPDSKASDAPSKITPVHRATCPQSQPSTRAKPHLSGQGSAHFSCKGPDSKYFRFCWSCSASVTNTRLCRGLAEAAGDGM